MRKYLVSLTTIIAMLLIVPQASGRWSSSNRYEGTGPVSVFSSYRYSLLENSNDENKTDLIELTIEHYNPHLEEDTQNRIITQIIKASKENDLDPFLVTAVIAAESSFKPKAKSHCGARGLMQLTRIVLPSLGVSDPFNVEQNIQGGCKFLGELYHRFGNTPLALAAYNAGPTRVARLNRIPRIPETQNYVEKVQWIAAVLFEHFHMALEMKSINPIAYITSLSKTHHNLITYCYNGGMNPKNVLDNSTGFRPESIYSYAEMTVASTSKLNFYNNELKLGFERDNYFG